MKKAAFLPTRQPDSVACLRWIKLQNDILNDSDGIPRNWSGENYFSPSRGCLKAPHHWFYFYVKGNLISNENSVFHQNIYSWELFLRREKRIFLFHIEAVIVSWVTVIIKKDLYEIKGNILPTPSIIPKVPLKCHPTNVRIDELYDRPPAKKKIHRRLKINFNSPNHSAMLFYSLIQSHFYEWIYESAAEEKFQFPRNE